MTIGELVTKAADRKTESFSWGEIEWFDSHDISGRDALTMGEVTIEPGEHNAEHVHSNCDEALLLLTGRLEHSIEDEETTLTAGDLLHIPRGKRHQARNPGSEDATAIIAYDTGEREFELSSESD